MDKAIIAALIGLTVALFGAIAAGYRWSGRVDGDLKTLNKFVTEMREQFMPEIRGKFEELLKTLPRSAFAPGSPLRLTDLGRQVAECLESREWASRVGGELKLQAERLEPYQIDDLARQYIEKNVNADEGEWAERIKKCAFESGVKREELPVVLRIVLRDELLRLTGQPLDSESQGSKPTA